MGYGDGIAKTTGCVGETEVDVFLKKNGFMSSRPPGQDMGIDRLVQVPGISSTARIQVKGRQQESNPRWFQLTVPAAQINDAWKKGECLADLWKKRIFLVDFWLLASIPKKEIWVLPSEVIFQIANDIAHRYLGRADNQYSSPHYNRAGVIQKKQKELNLDVCDINGIIIKDKYGFYKDNIEVLRQFFYNDDKTLSVARCNET